MLLRDREGEVALLPYFCNELEGRFLMGGTTTTAQKNRRRGKGVEKRVAKKLEGLRIGVLGREDVLTERFSVEVKSRQKLAFLKWWEQARKNVSGGRVPLLVVHQKHGKRYFVILELDDFLKLLEGEK